MRNNDERVAAVKRRIIEIEYKKKIRRNNFIAAASAVASFIIIIIMADFIPGLIGSNSLNNYSSYSTAASIFNNGAAKGYVIIAMTAFILGICVTILSYRIRQYNKKYMEELEEPDNQKESEEKNG